MPLFTIHVSTTGHEVYQVEAPTKEEVRHQFEHGYISKPVVMETISAEIESIEEDTIRSVRYAN